MRFEELNWMDVERYLERDDRLLFVLGATEQHGYLSLLTDIHIPLALADAASKETGVLVAPPLNFGVSPYFLHYPGTLSLRIETLLSAAADLVRSAYRQGFRRFVFLNGHGGNAPVQTRLYELANELPQLRAAWYAWWLSPAVQAVAAKHDLPLKHANWLEAFPFARVAELPQEAKPLLDEPVSALNAEQTRQYTGDGSYGGPYQVSDAIMDELFQAALADVVALLRFERP